MNEFEKYRNSFEMMWVSEGLTLRDLSEIPDEGMAGQFVEWLRDKPLKDQSFFLSCCATDRSEFVSRLLELRLESDFEARFHTYEGLSNTMFKKDSFRFFENEWNSRIKGDRSRTKEVSDLSLLRSLLVKKNPRAEKLGKKFAEEALRIGDKELHRLVLLAIKEIDMELDMY